MAMRDLIPWSRPENRAPVPYREEGMSPFLSLRREMDRLFDDFFRAPALGGLAASAAWPSLELSESDSEVKIVAELPGMNERDVDLYVEDGMLVLRGERKSESEERGYSERFYGRFERRIALPGGVDDKACRASFRDGVLTVTLPRNPEAQSGRRIPINAETRH